MNLKKRKIYYVLICIAIAAILLYISLVIPGRESTSGEPLFVFRKTKKETIDIDDIIENDLKTKELELTISVEDEGYNISHYSEGGYRYGPSIMRNADGSLDIWLSAPGNNSTEWDYVTYRHSDDGESWSSERTILRPTPGSSDKCSICDPGLIYFGGYYYLGYTSTYDSSRKGYNNSAFVARSTDPEGPYEKWNGSSWGGDPQPIIRYEGDPDGWGIGEISFVVKGDDLFIYYTYFDTNGGNICLAKADLVEDWPLTMREKGPVCPRDHQDSLDVVYVEELDTFLAFSIEYRMSESSRLIMYESKDGKNFTLADTTKTNIQDYAHNLGISKDPEGHISVDDDLIIGYGYGRGWGKWSARLHKVKLHYKFKE